MRIVLISSLWIAGCLGAVGQDGEDLRRRHVTASPDMASADLAQPLDLTQPPDLAQPIACRFYIDKNNASASDANPGTAALPWATIGKANATLAAGDTVCIKAGTYGQPIAPQRSGAPGAMITYRNDSSDVVTISNTTAAISLVGKSYIRVQGLQFSNLDRFLDLETASHNEIAYCIFDQPGGARSPWWWGGSSLGASSQYNWIHHCTFSNYGYFSSSTIFGTDLEIGSDLDTTDHSDYNLVENNVLFHGGHDVMSVYGRFNVVRNNYFHNENWMAGAGERNLSIFGSVQSSGTNLIEGNRVGFAGDPPPALNGPASGVSVSSHNNIIRKNSIYLNDGAGLAMSVTPNYPAAPQGNKVYNNTFYGNGRTTTYVPDGAGVELAYYGGPTISGNVVKNNILYRNLTPVGSYMVDLTTQTIRNNFSSGDPLFVDITSLASPSNSSLPDFHLRAGSPCIDAAEALTTITSASGPGTTFQVADAGYFMDGWGIVQGDSIQLSGSAQRARITHVDYATGTITVDVAISWTQGQGVNLTYLGAAPDLGAIESF